MLRFLVEMLGFLVEMLRFLVEMLRFSVEMRRLSLKKLKFLVEILKFLREMLEFFVEMLRVSVREISLNIESHDTLFREASIPLTAIKQVISWGKRGSLVVTKNDELHLLSPQTNPEKVHTFTTYMKCHQQHYKDRQKECQMISGGY